MPIPHIILGIFLTVSFAVVLFLSLYGILTFFLSRELEIVLFFVLIIYLFVMALVVKLLKYIYLLF